MEAGRNSQVSRQGADENAALNAVEGARTPSGQPAVGEQTGTLYRPPATSLVTRLYALAGRKLRHFGYGLKLYAYRLNGPYPRQLLASPDDPAPGNATLGSAMLGGDMLYGPERLELDGAPWSALWHKSPSFFNHGHSFVWLRHLAQVSDQAAARRVAETLTRQWLERHTNWDEAVWAPALVGSRLNNWIVHAPLILSSNDMVYRSAVLNSMARQARHLSRTLYDTPFGVNRVRAAAGLLLAGLLLPGGGQWQAKAAKALDRALAETINPDGGPISRTPAHAVKILRLLVLVRAAYIEAGHEMPDKLLFTIDRLAPFVRAMRHGGGALAQFNGTIGEGGFGTDAVLGASDASGRAITNASYSGFQRIEHGLTIIIMDTGCPPAGERSAASHAGTLSFEMSDGRERLFVNVGPAMPVGRFEELARLSRTTAAHTTLVMGDTNSSRMQDNGLLGKGVERVTVRRRSEAGGSWLTAAHDGYESRYGFSHERRILVDSAGFTIDGSDRLKPAGKKQKNTSALIRFHLHPAVDVQPGDDAHSARLRLASGSVWHFSADMPVQIEESLYMAQPDQPCSSRQLVIELDKVPAAGAEARWKIERQSS